MPNLPEWITQRVAAVERLAREAEGSLWQAALGEESVSAAVLRRCEADRRILERHRIDPSKADNWLDAVACMGCGWTGDCDDPVTENINDCPELLDLAHAHGITDDQLAGLDRPQPPPRKPHSGSLTKAFWDALTPRTPMSDVPAALRGPGWQPNN